MKRTYKSGAVKRKQTRESQREIDKLPKVTAYFIQRSSTDDTPSENSANHEGIPSDAFFPSTAQHAVSSSDSTPEKEVKNDAYTILKETDKEMNDDEVEPRFCDFITLSDDPADWPAPAEISDKQRCDIVQRGPPIQDETFSFPANSSKRRFTACHYYRHLPNGERMKRSWLMYSRINDKIYCFCCILFGSSDVPLRNGTSTWEGLSKKLQQHECGKCHQESMSKWFELRSRIESNAAIDDATLEIFFKERDFWRDILKRLMDIVLFLSDRNIAFRGTDERLGVHSNGNFLGLVELLAKYDTVLEKLVGRVKNKQTHIHYLSPDIQNELICLIARAIENVNVGALRKAKYYSVILDCTPDVSHKEQMSVVLRFVECLNGTGIKVREAFFGFLNVHDTTGEGLLKSFLEKAEVLGVDISDMRGQAYDHGANMSGKNKGVQARIMEMNPRALFVPCSSHTLNLVITDAAKSSNFAINFFGVINRIYVLYSSSPSRWAILEQCMPVSVKGLSDTRWESRIDAIKPLRYHMKEMLEALSSLKDHAITRKDGMTATEASALHEALNKWPFLLAICIWYDILFHINKTSKLLQSSSATVDVLQTEITATLSFFEQYRKEGYAKAAVSASEMAEQLDVEKVFTETRIRRKKVMFEYECKDEVPSSEEEKFRAQFFLPVIDQVISSVNSRFSQLSDWLNLFGFLYNRAQLLQFNDNNTLSIHCQNFMHKMGDINSSDLEMELRHFTIVVTKNPHLTTATDFLEYICSNDLMEIYPNTSIVLRIMLATPVTVASAERSFSRLKIIKNILRSTMSNERLNALGIISVEHDVAKSLDYNKLVDKFAEAKARKKKNFN